MKCHAIGLSAAVLSALVLVLSCSFPSTPDKVGIKFKIENATSVSRTTPPSDPFALSCFLVNVRGPGVAQTVPAISPQVTPACLGLGTTSKLVSLTELQSGITLEVKSGPERLIQLLGVQTASGVSCAGATLSDLFSPAALTSGAPSLYVLGSTKRDLYRDDTVALTNSYASSTAPPDLVTACHGTSLTITSSAPTFIYRGAVAFASGFPSTTDAASFAGDLTTIPDASSGYLQRVSNPVLGPGFRAEYAGGPSYGARMDTVFVLANGDVSQYNQITVNVGANGGLEPRSTGCQTAANFDSSGSGFRAYIFNNSTHAWDLIADRPTSTTGIGVAAAVPFFNSNLGQYVTFVSNEAVTNVPAFFFTLRSKNAVGSIDPYCSAVELQSMSFTLSQTSSR